MARQESKAVQPERRPIAVELFAGAGGMSLGFEQAGFDVLASYDSDPVHVCTHRFNFPSTLSLCADVGDLSGRRVLADIADLPQLRGQSATDIDLDCIFGGPSCQGFSEIGRMDGADERNDLVFQFARLIGELRPKYFVMENVPGFASRRYAGVVRDLCDQFRRAGYQLLNDGPLRLEASEFGVPQIRKRVFLIGARADLDLPHKPEPSLDVVAVCDALDDLPDADAFLTLLDSDAVRLRRAPGNPRSSYAAAMAADDGVDHVAAPRVWDPQVLTSSRRTVHSDDVVARFNALGPGDIDATSRLRRLDADVASFTLRAGTGRDHGSFTASRPVHHSKPRVITVREAARLHSFPDWFRFHTTKWHGFRQVGNAVPPRFARAVASTVVRALHHEPKAISRAVSLGDPALLTHSMNEAAEVLGVAQELLPQDVRVRHGRS